MAKIRIAPEILADLLFGYTPQPVKVEGAGVDADGCLLFFITGADVPEIPEVRAICTVEQNRAGQRLVRMTFEPAP